MYDIGQTDEFICECMNPNCDTEHNHEENGDRPSYHYHPLGYGCNEKCKPHPVTGNILHQHAPGEPHKTHSDIPSFTARERKLELERWLNNWRYISNNPNNTELVTTGGYTFNGRTTISNTMVQEHGANPYRTYTPFKLTN